MINDEQRRDVAMSLRTAKQSELWRLSDGELIDTVADAIGVDGMSRHYEATLFDRLADLIDRPTCHDTKDKHGKAFTCSRCGFSNSTLVFDPFAIEFIKLKPNYHHCPNCGAEIID